MSDLRIDENNELSIVDGDLVLTTAPTDNILQSIRQNIRVMKGEWFLDRTMGLPYFEIILEKNPNSVLVSNLFQNIILETKGVTKLDVFELSFNRKERTLSVRFEATITTGEVIYFEEAI